jgi:hypothetical protein
MLGAGDLPPLRGGYDGQPDNSPKEDLMNLSDWGARVDNRLVQLIPSLRRCLVGKNASGNVAARKLNKEFEQAIEVAASMLKSRMNRIVGEAVRRRPTCAT